MSVATSRNLRPSNGMREFLWLISDLGHGSLLDVGPVWQSTVSFFVERGFKVSTEDLLRAWKEFLDNQAERLRLQAAGDDEEEMTPAALAEKFLESTLVYPAESFNAVLAWDVFDYLDGELLPRVVQRLYDLLRPGGAVMGLFHSRPAEGFHRYRIVDSQSIEVLPAPGAFPHQRSFQNRELLNLFAQFRSSKTFVGRDQIREGLFLK
jgi:SAM-dependent methyltransferase